MRALVLLLSLGISTSLHATTSVRFHTDRTELTTGHELNLFIENDGTEALIEPRVDIELEPGLEFRGAIRHVGDGWICGIVAGRQATCRAPSIAAGASNGLFFGVQTARGGRFNVQATFSAQNLTGTPQITFHVASNRYIEVRSAEDFGEGTLRAAIEAVNDDPLCGTIAQCTISFCCPMTIAPAVPLPPIRKCNVRIDGGIGIEPQDQPKPIVISGQNALWGNGLEVRASCADNLRGVELQSLVVHSWPWNGIYFEAPAPHRAMHSINLSYIGTSPMGTEARPNRGRGVVTDSPYERLAIYNSVISGNGRSGVALFRGELVWINGDKIGISRFHQPLGNGASGVFSFGVPMFIGGGIIAYNAHAGVSIARGTPGAGTEHTLIHSNGGLPIDWGLDDRTLPDDDSDRIPNTPRITDAFYDAGANVTRVRGTVRVRRGVFASDVYTVQSYVASSERGDVVEPLASGYQAIPLPEDDEARDVDFEIALPGDYRGKLIAVRLNIHMSNLTASLTSEISEAAAVR